MAAGHAHPGFELRRGRRPRAGPPRLGLRRRSLASHMFSPAHMRMAFNTDPEPGHCTRNLVTWGGHLTGETGNLRPHEGQGSGRPECCRGDRHACLAGNVTCQACLSELLTLALGQSRAVHVHLWQFVGAGRHLRSGCYKGEIGEAGAHHTSARVCAPKKTPMQPLTPTPTRGDALQGHSWRGSWHRQGNAHAHQVVTNATSDR